LQVIAVLQGNQVAVKTKESYMYRTSLSLVLVAAMLVAFVGPSHGQIGKQWRFFTAYKSVAARLAQAQASNKAIVLRICVDGSWVKGDQKFKALDHREVVYRSFNQGVNLARGQVCDLFALPLHSIKAGTRSVKYYLSRLKRKSLTEVTLEPVE